MNKRPNLLPESKFMLAPLDLRFKRRRRLFNGQLLITLVFILWDSIHSPTMDYAFSACCSATIFMTLFLQMLIYNWREPELTKLRSSVESMWTDHFSTVTGSRELFKKVTKECRIRHFICCSPVISVTIVNTIGVMEYLKYLIANRRIPDPSELTRFIYFSIPLVNTLVSPLYEATYLFVFLSCFTLFWKMSGINSLLLGLTSHITALHHSIISALGEIQNPGYLSSSTGAENYRKLRNCVEKQTKLLRAVSRLQHNTRLYLLTLFTLSSIILGLSLFEISVTTNSLTLRAKWLNIAIFMTSTMLMYSWKSQKLIDATNDLSFAYYNTPWYNEPLKFGRTVLSAMQNLEKPFGLSVIYYQLNNETFGQLISKATSYFTIFNTIIKDNRK